MFQWSIGSTQVISPNLKPVSGTGLLWHYGVIVLFTKGSEKWKKKKDGEDAMRKNV